MEKRFFIIANILLAGILLLTHLRLYLYGYDDAYIHFRIARNLYETGFPYFNAGEAIKVSTSTAWILTLEIIYSLANALGAVGAFPLFVAIWNAAMTLAGVNLSLLLFQSLFPDQRSSFLSIAVGGAYLTIMLPVSIGLMETPTAMLIAIFGILLLLKGRQVGFLFLSLAAYYRIELAALVILAFAFVIITKSFKKISILYAVLGALPFILFDLSYYRTIIPGSIHAKSIVYQIHSLATLLDILGSPAALLRFDQIQEIIRGVAIYFYLVLIIGLLVIVVSELRHKRYTWIVFFAVWSLTIVAGYTISHTYIFDWYTPLFLVPTAIATASFIRQGKHKASVLLSFAGIALILLQGIGLVQTMAAAIVDPAFYANFAEGARVRQYLSVGAQLYRDYPHATLLSSEIGGLGYAFQGYIYDAAGLASPQALMYHPLPFPSERPNGYIGAIPPRYVAEVQPDIIVSYDVFAEALLASPFIEAYKDNTLPVFTPADAHLAFSQILWNSSSLHVLIRNNNWVSRP